MCLRLLWGSKGVTSKEPQQEEAGQAQKGEVLSQIQERSSPGTNSLPGPWPKPYPCCPGWTSLCWHHHCLYCIGRGDGGENEGFASSVEPSHARDRSSWKGWEKTCNWTHDLLVQRANVRDELWRMEQDLKSKREELEQLEAEDPGLRNIGPVVTFSVSGL